MKFESKNRNHTLTLRKSSTWVQGRLIAVEYRKLHIIATVCNNTFQTYIWPLTHYGVALSTIFSSYVLLFFKNSLPAFVCLELALTTSGGLVLEGILLELGSEPYSLSRKCVASFRNTQGSGPWLRKFVRSCQPIVLRVGFYTRVDKSIYLNLVRFVQQRLSMLIVYTRLNTPHTN